MVNPISSDIHRVVHILVKCKITERLYKYSTALKWGFLHSI